MGTTGGGICLIVSKKAVPARDREIDGTANLENIPNITTGVFSNGAGAMLSASYLGSLSSYTHFKHIAVEELKVQADARGT